MMLSAVRFDGFPRPLFVPCHDLLRHVIAVPTCVGNGMAGRFRTVANRVRGIAHSMPALLPCCLYTALERVGIRRQARMRQRAEGGEHYRNDRSSSLHHSNFRLVRKAGSRPVGGEGTYAAAPSDYRSHTLRGDTFHLLVW